MHTRSEDDSDIATLKPKLTGLRPFVNQYAECQGNVDHRVIQHDVQNGSPRHKYVPGADATRLEQRRPRRPTCLTNARGRASTPPPSGRDPRRTAPTSWPAAPAA